MHESPEYAQHREETAKRLSHEGRKFFKFIEFDPSEQLITEIRKHPIGLIITLLTGGLIVLALLVATAFAASADLSSIFGSSAGSVSMIITIASVLLLFGTAVMTYIAAFLYVSNVIFVTSEKIAQVLYISLFHRKISQLSIGDVQDVTVTQKGILAHIFNYGVLVIETAGEQQNYTFSYVPDPYQVSKLIVGSHEENLTKYGN